MHPRRGASALESDATSEEWLTSLVERLAGAALLVLVTYRPGYQPSWLARSYATQMALSPLQAEDGQTVVRAVLQTASVLETVVHEIVTQTAGNPFFYTTPSLSHPRLRLFKLPYCRRCSSVVPGSRLFIGIGGSQQSGLGKRTRPQLQADR